jgi:hypothetical protein
MARDTFDSLTRLLATSPTRRVALGALLGGGLAEVFDPVASARKSRKAKRPRRAKRATRGAIAVEASCANPGPSRNMNGCNFNGDDLSDANLSSSKMVATTFRDATLVGTNLSSSNMKQADFRRANLCGAVLRSSTLKDADFRGANLTNAKLTSSGCGGLRTNAGTTFCNTTMCNGSVRNDGCGAPEAEACAALLCTDDDDCGLGETCANGICRCGSGLACGEERVCNEDGECVHPTCCGGSATCGAYTSVGTLCCATGRAAFCCCDSAPGANDGFLGGCRDTSEPLPVCPTDAGATGGSACCPGVDGVCVQGGSAIAGCLG